MIQPKYNPKEALKRAKLMMGYDTSKTLTENVKTLKRPLNEGADLATGVKNILDGCLSNPNGIGAPFMDNSDVDRLASNFVEAFSSSMGTDNDLWKKALKEMKGKGGYADLCNIAKSYEEQADEDFYEGIDSDIDYDNEWSEFVAAFTMMKNRTKGQQKTKEQESATISGWESKFPCVFKTNSNVEKGVRQDANLFNYILVKGNSGKKYALFYDGRMKTEDFKLIGKKLTCNGDRPAVVAESVKKKLAEQIDDSGIGGASTGIDDGGSTQNQTSTQKPRTRVASSYTDCTGTYKKGCKSDVIVKVQGCLNDDDTLNINPKLVPDGKFGNLTQAALTKKGFTTFTDADVDKICTKPLPDDEYTGGEPQNDEETDDVFKKY
jgi:hypothetical protein